ncbi:MAG: hypothetical protein WCI46_10120 [Verrucomicrobiota bacterium]|jgi:hypothetical protein
MAKPFNRIRAFLLVTPGYFLFAAFAILYYLQNTNLTGLWVVLGMNPLEVYPHLFVLLIAIAPVCFILQCWAFVDIGRSAGHCWERLGFGFANLAAFGFEGALFYFFLKALNIGHRWSS